MAGLVLGCLAALLALAGELWLAWIAFLGTGVADAFDGKVARRLDLDAEDRVFGESLDSLVDTASFGFAPVVLLYASGVDGWAGGAVLAVYLCAVVWRLATFAVVGVEDQGERQVYRGLPVTYAALLLPLGALMALADADGRILPWVLGGEALVLAGLMQSRLGVPRPRPWVLALLLGAGTVVGGCFLYARLRGWEFPV